ncbi:GGDEF domain-containing protein, partial [Micromonospora humida]
MHVHLLLHLLRTASMITHVDGTYPFTLGYQAQGFTWANDDPAGHDGAAARVVRRHCEGGPVPDPLTVASGVSAAGALVSVWQLRRRALQAEAELEQLQAELAAERHAASHDPL